MSQSPMILVLRPGSAEMGVAVRESSVVLVVTDIDIVRVCWHILERVWVRLLAGLVHQMASLQEIV